MHDLHIVIQRLFDWENSHLYHFLVPPGGKLTQKAMSEAKRYHVLPPEPIFDDEENEDRPADEALLGQVLNAAQKQIIYEYDFGDSWEHLVKVEKRSPVGSQYEIPVCVAGENAAPPDDSGGIGGYFHWLEALRNEKDQSHEDAVEWLGADFTPTRFDLERVNQELKAAFKRAPKKRRSE